MATVLTEYYCPHLTSGQAYALAIVFAAHADYLCDECADKLSMAFDSDYPVTVDLATFEPEELPSRNELSDDAQIARENDA